MFRRHRFHVARVALITGNWRRAYDVWLDPRTLRTASTVSNRFVLRSAPARQDLGIAPWCERPDLESAVAFGRVLPGAPDPVLIAKAATEQCAAEQIGLHPAKLLGRDVEFATDHEHALVVIADTGELLFAHLQQQIKPALVGRRALVCKASPLTGQTGEAGDGWNSRCQSKNAQNKTGGATTPRGQRGISEPPVAGQCRRHNQGRREVIERRKRREVPCMKPL